MTIDSMEDIQQLKKIGAIVSRTIREMKRQARAGMTTKELDEIGANVLKSYGAKSAPKSMYQFPGYTCISLNRDVAHGIPGDQMIRPGDLINIDVSAELNGYYADAGHSFQIAPYSRTVTRLCEYTHDTMMKVIAKLKHGVKLNEVGKTIEAEAKRGGYKVIHNLCSHGIGKALHEEPKHIYPVYDKRDQRVLTEGLVITIEPFLSTGAEYVVEQPDGWTLRVPDQSYVAQHEHTLIITRNEPIIVTAV